MNRGMMNLGAQSSLVVLSVFVLSAVFAGKASGVGSPAQLRQLTDKELQKMEQVIPTEAKAKPEHKRKILVFWLCKGYFHESIPVINEAIELMGKKTGAYEAVLSDDMNEFSADKLAEFDAVLFNNTTRLDFKEASQRQALMDFVKGGKGIIGIHAATDNFYNWPEAADMMGGLFVAHPWTAGGTWAIKNVDPNHPLNSAFEGKGFKIRDEIYRQKKLRPVENRRILLTLDLDDPATRNAKGAEESDRDMPVSWIKDYDKGRVFYCGLGHNNEVIFRPAILRHYLDGIQFALGDLKVDATPVKENK
ncbi:MAG: ThuA domain-containing protein [Planctomycetota bacterium]